MSPYLPVTGEEIAEQAIGAAEAGAAILHLHARDPRMAAPRPIPSISWASCPDPAGCDAVINLSTGGSAVMTLDQRLAGPLAARPEMASLNMGTMNFALYPMLGARTRMAARLGGALPAQLGRPGVQATPRATSRHPAAPGRERGARFEFECYDVGHLHMLAHFATAGWSGRRSSSSS
jgi:uncharacterized protein (DUF849 family)